MLGRSPRGKCGLRGRYYYRKQRRGGAVRSTYLGSDPLAVVLADLETLAQQRRAEVHAAGAAQRAEVRTTEEGVDAVCESIGLLVDVAMLARGYHRHKGQWSRRRDGLR